MSHKSVIRQLQFVNGQNPGTREGWGFPAPHASDATFLRSWLVYDSKLASGEHRGKFNWNFFVGLLLAGGASAGFWAGIGLVISNLK